MFSRTIRAAWGWVQALPARAGWVEGGGESGGSGNPTIPTITCSGTGTVTHLGTGIAVIPQTILSGETAVGHVGQGSRSIPVVVSSGSGRYRTASAGNGKRLHVAGVIENYNIDAVMSGYYEIEAVMQAQYRIDGELELSEM